MKHSSVQHIWSLFFLPLVLGSTSESAPGLATILILLFILLLLLILLFFSWHKLNMATDGQYHPRNLWQGGSDGEEGEGTVALLAGAVTRQWQVLRTRVTGGPSDHLSQYEDDTQPESTEAYAHGDIESVGKNEDGQDTQGQSEDNETDEEDYSSMGNINPSSMQAIKESGIAKNAQVSNSRTEDTTGSLLPTETKASSDASVGSSEALLAHQHDFSAPEVWEDSSVEGSVSIRVTAL